MERDLISESSTTTEIPLAVDPMICAHTKSRKWVGYSSVDVESYRVCLVYRVGWAPAPCDLVKWITSHKMGRESRDKCCNFYVRVFECIGYLLCCISCFFSRRFFSGWLLGCLKLTHNFLLRINLTSQINTHCLPSFLWLVLQASEGVMWQCLS